MDYVGRTILGYHLVRLLGRGGFASVYLGERAQTREQAQAREQVAIKIFHDGSNFKEIRDEAEHMARLGGHPHIVQVLPVNQDQQGRPNYVGRDESQRLYLIMEFAAHGSLRMKMQPDQVFPLADVVPFVKQIASALQAIHHAGMIHRDVKPNNILLSEDDRLLVTDFGIARDIVPGGVHHTLKVTGTIGYMGPEQLAGNPTARSDQYALAVITYELLTGKKPIEDEGAGLLYQIEKTKNALPTHPIQWNPRIPPAVDAVIMRGLEKDENLRFPSVIDFANDLDEAAQGRVPRSISLSNISTAQAAASNPLTSRSVSRETVPFGASLGPTATGGARVGLCVLPHDIQHLRWSSYGSELVILTRERPPAAVTRPRQTVPPGAAKNPAPGPNPGTGTTPRELETTVHLWTPNEPQPSVSYKLNNGHLSPNGAYIARPVGKAIEVHDLAAQQRVVAYQGHTGTIKKIAWSPDTKYIASTDEGPTPTIQVWDALSGTLLNTGLNTGWSGIYRLHGAPVTAVAWSPPLGEHIASCDQNGSLQLWNAISGAKIIDAPHPLRNLTFLEWQPTIGSRYILLAARDEIRLWDTSRNVLKEPCQLERLDQHLVRWSPDGQYLAARTSDDEVRVWSVEEHAESATGLRTVATCKCESSVHAFTWSPSGAVLAIGELGVVEIWSTQAEVPIFVYQQQFNKRVTALDWSSDGSLIASGGQDKQVHVWKSGNFLPKPTSLPFETTVQKTGYLSKTIRQRLGRRRTGKLVMLAAADVILPWFVTAALPAALALLGFVLPYLAVGLAVYRLWRWRPANTKPVLGKWQVFLITILLTALWASAAWALGTVFFKGSCLVAICALIGLGFGLHVHRSMLATLNNRLKPNK